MLYLIGGIDGFLYYVIIFVYVVRYCLLLSSCTCAILYNIFRVRCRGHDDNIYFVVFTTAEKRKRDRRTVGSIMLIDRGAAQAKKGERHIKVNNNEPNFSKNTNESSTYQFSKKGQLDGNYHPKREFPGPERVRPCALQCVRVAALGGIKGTYCLPPRGGIPGTGGPLKIAILCGMLGLILGGRGIDPDGK